MRDVANVDSQNCLEGELKAAFKYCIERTKHRFLLLDLSAGCPDKLRIRTVDEDDIIHVFYQ